MEVRTSWKLSLLWEASRAFSSSALDTYWLTCGGGSPHGHFGSTYPTHQLLLLQQGGWGRGRTG